MAAPSSTAVKYERDYFASLAKIVMTVPPHSYFQLDLPRGSVFHERMTILIRKCSTHGEIINALSHAIIKNLREKVNSRDILPTTVDAISANDHIKVNKEEAFAAVTIEELKELEKEMARRDRHKKVEEPVFKFPRFLFFRIDGTGAVAGFLEEKDALPYPGESTILEVETPVVDAPADEEFLGAELALEQQSSVASVDSEAGAGMQEDIVEETGAEEDTVSGLEHVPDPVESGEALEEDDMGEEEVEKEEYQPVTPPKYRPTTPLGTEFGPLIQEEGYRANIFVDSKWSPRRHADGTIWEQDRTWAK